MPVVMHIALRSPKGKRFMVDGEDVVPEIHNVLDKVRSSQCCLP